MPVGSDVTFAAAFANLGRAIKPIDEAYNYANSNAQNYMALEDALTTNADGEYAPEQLAALRRRVRGPLAAMFEPAALREVMHPHLLEIARAAVTAPELIGGGASDYDLLRRIRDYMVANAQTLNGRGMTIDATATGSNGAGAIVGNGAGYRCVVDKDNFPLEAIGPEDKRLICRKDQLSQGGVKHGEVFAFEGTAQQKDGVYWNGSGAKREITSLHAKSSNLLRNGSFETGAVTDSVSPASTTAIDGWSVGTAANVRFRNASTYYYRGYPGNPTTATGGDSLWGIEFTVSDTLTQIIRRATPGAGIDPRVPYLPWVRYKRKASATGTLTLNAGSKSVAATIGSATNDVWNTLVLGPANNNFYDNFKQDELVFSLAVSSLAVGTLVIDDAGWAPMAALDGTFWAILGGDTPWSRNDQLLYTDVEGGSRAKFSYWLWRAYAEELERGAGDLSALLNLYGWLPTNNAAGETIVDV